MKKFRVLSDLHIDYNREYPLKLKKDDVFTVIAGDTSGEQEMFSVTPSRKAIKVVNGADVSDVMKDCETISIVYRKEENTDLGYWTLGEKYFSPMKHGIRITNYDKLKDGDMLTIKKTTPYSWIRDNVSSGIVIAGNHIVYNKMKKPIEELKEMFAREFPEDSDITFLDCETGVMSKEVDGILFIGSTLYTNYELPVRDCDFVGTKTILTMEERKEINMRFATPKMSGGGMNDFNFGRTKNGKYKKEPWDDDELYYLSPKNYLEWFHKTFDKIKEIVENNPNKKIVIVTHHCPSTKCISQDYVDDRMNASYVSDLDDFITSHPQIKCWICGHVHHRDSFYIGKCLCVMNPLGYCRHAQYVGLEDRPAWSPDVFVNTENWTVERKPYSNKDWDDELERHQNAMLKYAGMFF